MTTPVAGVPLDAGSGVSPYLPLVRQVRPALRLGLLREGDQLPTVKDVVARLAINPNTVLKAYRELEYQGLAAARPGIGTFVTGPLSGESLAAHGPLRRDLQRWLTKARRAGRDDARTADRLTPGGDAGRAPGGMERLGWAPAQKAGKLSGGQRAQPALPRAIAKHPELLPLDEPVASLDPLARREFLQDLMEAVAEQELSVVLSSHLVADLERVCDYLIVLIGSQVRVAGPVDELLAAHHLLTGPRRDPR